VGECQSFASMTVTMATNLTFAIVVQKPTNNILLTVKRGEQKHVVTVTRSSCENHLTIKFHGCAVTVCRKFVKGGAAIGHNVRGCTAADILSS